LKHPPETRKCQPGDDRLTTNRDPKQLEAVAAAAERQFASIRGRLVERRQQLGMSMSELARTIGVSPSMISQIERGQSLPSVETLFALAAALGATVDTFFSSADADPGRSTPLATVRRAGDGNLGQVQGSPHVANEDSAGPAPHRYVVRRDQRAAIDIQGGVRWERLTPFAMEEVEFLELIYEPGAQSNEHLYRHPGFEMVVVLEGRFEIHVGFETYTLDVGDGIAFASSLPHRYVNPLSQVSRAITTILRDPAAAQLGATGTSASMLGGAQP
jgi:DNA-binding XRE family transcriptional regulator/quercetin dioxygenase-like cupin family protein